MVFFRVIQNRLCAFDVAGCRLYFHKGTFPFVANDKVHLQAGVLVEVIELSSHLGKNIRDQVFEDSSFVAVKIALQNVILGAVFQHTDKQPHITHIYLKGVLLFSLAS